MKKFLPVIILFVGIVVLIGVYAFVIKGKDKNGGLEDENSAYIELSLNERPILSLVPTDDGHWLEMKVEKIMVPDAETLEYELVYTTAEGGQQGVPGTKQLSGQDEVGEKLLLGSESSGKFRYDEGVEQGTLTISFRNAEGKLRTEFTSDFRLYTNTTSLLSADGYFNVEFKKPTKNYYVVMDSIGIPSETPSELLKGPYGLFASGVGGGTGSVSISEGNIFKWDEDGWTDEVGADSFSSGIYVSVK